MANFVRNCNGLLPTPQLGYSSTHSYTPAHIPPPTAFSQAPIGVFWDIENCNIPHGKSALAICDEIRKQPFFEGHSEKQFVVVCDAQKEKEKVLDEIDKAQVDVIHVASNKKNAADDKLKNVMRRFADQHGEGARIVLISGDIDFAADISDFKRRKCLSIILIHSKNASEALLMAATETYDYGQLVATIPMRPDSTPGYQCLQLTVSNLPSVKDVSGDYIIDTLNDIAKKCDGKVAERDIRNGSAILQFTSVTNAERFRKRYVNYNIDGRRINIFNYHGRRGKSPLNRNPSPWKPIGHWRSHSQSPGPRKRYLNRNKSADRMFSRDKSQSSSGDEVVVEESCDGNKDQHVTFQALKDQEQGLDRIKFLNIGTSMAKSKRKRAKAKSGSSSSYSDDLSSDVEIESSAKGELIVNTLAKTGLNVNLSPKQSLDEKNQLRTRNRSRKQSGNIAKNLEDANVVSESGPDCVKMLIFVTNTKSTCSVVEVRMRQEIIKQNIKIKASRSERGSVAIKVEIECENFDEAVKLLEHFDKQSLDGNEINVIFSNDSDEVKYRAEQVLLNLRGEASWTQFRETYSDMYKNGISLLQAKELSNVEIIDKDTEKCIALKNSSLLWKMISLEEQELVLGNINELLHEKPEFTIPIEQIKEEYFKRFGRTITSLINLVAEGNFSNIKILKNHTLSLPKAVVVRKVARNLNILISDFPSGIIPLKNVVNLYEEKFGGNLCIILKQQEISSLPHLIDQCGKPLIAINFNMTPQMTTIQGKFIADFVKRVLDTFFHILDTRNISRVPPPLFLDEYRIMHGPYTFVDLDYICRELGDIVNCHHEDGEDLFELSPLYRLGNEIVMVLREIGGVTNVANIQNEYSKQLHKNLQPVRYGYQNMEMLLLELDLFVKVVGKNGSKSVILKSLYDQHCLRERRSRSDSGSGYGSVTPPIPRSSYQNYRQSPSRTQHSSHALRSTPDLLGDISQKLPANVSQGVKSVRQEQMLAAGSSMSTKERMRMSPTLSCNLTLSSPPRPAGIRKESVRSNSTSSKEELDFAEHPPSPAYSTSKAEIITLGDSDDEETDSRHPTENKQSALVQHQEARQGKKPRKKLPKNKRMAAFFPDNN